MVDRQEVLTLYKQYKSYTAVGRLLGISKQRVDQILRILNDPEVEKIRLAYHFKPARCIVCNRSFKGLAHGTNDTCKACVNYLYRRSLGIKSDYMRHITYPEKCTDCKKPTVSGKRVRGYCFGCYKKRFIYKMLWYKESQKKHRLNHQEEHKERCRKYYYAHREQMREYQKQKYIGQMVA